ncbi:hypothetical protein [Cryobacterium cryoconiti]|uniref:hypothetical protein n=1 Tax=Cryobacterium cryoconiti TaxID=1259239 RepID=UPI00141ABCA5|nr:hypothetical protein [Cryobacterium cryoconiti]
MRDDLEHLHLDEDPDTLPDDDPDLISGHHRLAQLRSQEGDVVELRGTAKRPALPE